MVGLDIGVVNYGNHFGCSVVVMTFMVSLAMTVTLDVVVSSLSLSSISWNLRFEHLDH